MMTKVLVLMGGPDTERSVSLDSGKAVANGLRESGTFTVIEEVINRITVKELGEMEGEVIFPVLHGPWGEGGGLQKILEEDGRPFVGSGSEAAGLAMDKLLTKQVLADKGVPTPAAHLLNPDKSNVMELPIVLKPNEEGSSVGIHICRTDSELQEILKNSNIGEGYLVEEFIEGREVTVSVVGGKALPLLEIRTGAEFYDYEAKYVRSDTHYMLRPELGAGVSELCTEYAVRAYEELGCRDVARVDFMVDERGPWFLELNTIPGFTSHSLLPMAARAAGMTMPELCGGLVEAALERAVRV